MKKLVSLIFMVLLALCFSVTAFAGSVAGLCGAYNDGESIEWSLVLEEGTLKIKGGGPMADYSEEEPAPWYDYREFIKKIEYEGEIERIGNYAFKDCYNITGTITFPENLHYIGDHAYENCTGFTGDLVIPASFSIGKAAFKNCTGFSGDLVIKSSQDLIDDEAFMNCSGFKGKLVLGKKISNGSERIGARAFMNCTGFEKDVIVPYMIKNIGNNAFTNCGADNFYFYSNPPTLEEGYKNNHPFDVQNDTLYRFVDNSGWENGEGKPFEGFTFKENEKDIVSGYCGGYDGFNLTWRLNCDEILVISGEGPMVNYHPKNGEYAPWYDYAVRGIIVEEGVTTIGDGAFYGLTHVNSGTISLPSTLETIGNNAFENCWNYSGNLVVPENVTSIGHYAFHNCERMSGALILPESLTFIGAGAFQNCEALSAAVVFPEKLQEISYDAFLGCSVNDYYFRSQIRDPLIQPASSERPSFDSWDELHFAQSFVIYENQWQGYYADNVYADAVIDSGNCGAMGEQLEVQWELTAGGTLIISGTGRMADFERKYIYYQWGCTAPWYEYKDQITAIVIEDGVQYIGDYAFYRLFNATGEIVLPESLTEIGDCAFNLCYNLYGELELPISLTAIGEYAFEGCDNLTGNLIVPDSITTLGEGAFTGCRGFDGILYISESLKTIERYAFSGCNNLTGTLSIGTWVTEIGDSAFQSCKNLSGDLIIPDSVVRIGSSAFQYCYGFGGNLSIGTGVTEIGDSAFRDCKNLSGDIVIPDNVTEVYFGAFENCRSFDGKLVIGSGINRLRDYVFSGCENIEEEVYIPANIRYMGYHVFENCGGKYYTFEWDPPVDIYEASSDNPSFDAQYDRIIYPEDNTNWNLEDGKWMGYTVGREAISFVYGDLNDDGEVNVIDVFITRLISAKLLDADKIQKLSGDVDGDKKITAIDANIIRKRAVGIIDSLPV